MTVVTRSMLKKTTSKPVNSTPARSDSPSRAVSVGNCKYRKVLIDDINIIDRGRNEIFSPLSVKDRLRSSRKEVTFPVIIL